VWPRTQGAEEPTVRTALTVAPAFLGQRRREAEIYQKEKSFRLLATDIPLGSCFSPLTLSSTPQRLGASHFFPRYVCPATSVWASKVRYTGCVAAIDSANSLTQRRQGTKTRKAHLLRPLCTLCAFAPWREMHLVVRGFSYIFVAGSLLPGLPCRAAKAKGESRTRSINRRSSSENRKWLRGQR
jgi:hypothetical protein